MTDARVIGAGLVTIDIVQLCDEDFHPTAEPPSYMSGGTVSNILSYLAVLDSAPCTLFGGVGDDELGPVLLEDLRGFRVNTDEMITRPGKATRRIVHLIAVGQTGGHKFLTKCYRCDRQLPAFEPPTLEECAPAIAKHRLSATVLIVDRANELTVDIAKRVSAANGVVVFEPGYVSRKRHLVTEMVSLANILKYSADLQWGDTLFRDAIPKTRPKLKLIIETRSSKGIRLVSIPHQTEIWLTTTPLMTVRDAAGAGDAFMAGFLKGLGLKTLLRLETVSLEKLESAAQRGQALGAIACSFYGSKGVLYAKSAEEIGRAVDETVASLRLPGDFGSTKLPPRVLGEAAAGLCPVCRISLRADEAS